MKIIICGAGQVGESIAAHLSEEENDVTMLLYEIICVVCTCCLCTL